MNCFYKYIIFGALFLLTTPVNAKVTIALVAPKAGDYVQQGAELSKGVKKAVDEINSQGGLLNKKVHLLEVDDECNDAMAISTAQMLAVSKENPINLVIGPYCANSFDTVADVFAKAKIFQIIPTTVKSIAEDRDGNIWIGTGVGPFYIDKKEIGNQNITLQQVKVPRNDGTSYADYLLSGVTITSICVDPGNRKWFGTTDNGAYLISADNLTQIHHFKTDNSKLLSNIINDIKINQKSGEVFFATENGLCSYMSDATETSETMTDDNVYAYPNPVTPDYTGLITIVGLSYDADVKITASNGAVIAEGRSNGGMFTWDGCDKSGKRVASGIYLVITATSDGKSGTCCKIAVIK